LYEKAITIIQDKQHVIPIATLENRHFIYVNTALEQSGDFYQYLNKYVHTPQLALDDKTDVESLSDSLKEKHVIIVGVFPQTPAYLIAKIGMLAQRAAPTHEIIICDFGNENFLRARYSEYSSYYRLHSGDRNIASDPQVIFGGLKLTGVLPYTFSGDAPRKVVA
jgi:hypothetical protein